MGKNQIMDPAKFMDSKPMITGGLLDVALSTLELLDENDQSTLRLLEMIEGSDTSRQELLDKVISELTDLSLLEKMDAPYAGLNPLFPL